MKPNQAPEYRAYKRQLMADHLRRDLPPFVIGLVAAGVVATSIVLWISRAPASIALPWRSATPTSIGAIQQPNRQAPAATIQFAVQPSATTTVAVMSLPTAVPVVPARGIRESDNVSGPSVPSLQQLMLRLVNEDRRAQRLAPVVWDEQAAIIGQKHAEEMARMDYFSHWDTAGRGPDTRYALEGGLASAMENISSRWDTRFIGGIGVSSSDWESAIREAQVGLMNSPGHRANILTPAHTQLGIGIAFNLNTGKLYIAQEFVDQYVKLVPLPNRLTTAADIEIRGELLGRASDPLVDIAFERKPSPLTPTQLNSQYAGAYSFQAQSINQFAVSPQLNGRNFSTTLRIGQRGAGLYHVRVFVMVDGLQAMTVDRVVIVEP